MKNPLANVVVMADECPGLPCRGWAHRQRRRLLRVEGCWILASEDGPKQRLQTKMYPASWRPRTDLSKLQTRAQQCYSGNTVSTTRCGVFSSPFAAAAMRAALFVSSE